MKLFALIIAAFAALAPMQAYAGTGSDQTSVQVPKSEPQLQVAGGDDNDECEGVITICVDVDV